MTVLHPRDLGFGILFDLIRDAVIVADVESERIALINPAAATLFGYDPGEAVGLPLETIVPPQLRAAHHAGIVSYRETRHGALIERAAAVSVPALRRDGTTIAVELRLSPMTGIADGRYVMALIRDVTERDALLRRLGETTTNLQLALQTEQYASRHYAQLVELKDDFLAMLSHDLGGPLSAIGGYADLLRRSWDRLNQHQRSDALEAIERSTRRMTLLVRDVLDAARLDAGAMTFRPEPVDVVAALGEAIGDQGPDVADRVTLSAAGEPATAWTDPARHAQVAGNLLSNALKFSPPGSRVDVSVLSGPDQVSVSVRDRGPGVAEADRERLFGRFHRLAGDGDQVAGSGLGLYITRRLVEDQGGTISVDNHPDGGAVFRYTLPTAGRAAR